MALYDFSQQTFDNVVLTAVPVPGDANVDGAVNGTDLNTVLSNYNQSSGVSAAGVAVPEPCTLATLAIGTIGVLAWTGWRRRK